MVQYIWDNMGYSISQEKILTKSKKNNNLTKLHTSHAASTTPTAAPTRITVGAFLCLAQNRGNKKQWFITSTELRTLPSTELRTLRGARVIKDGGSLPAHRAEITLRGPRSRNIKKRLYRRVEMSDKGKVKKIRRLGNTVTFLISNKLPNKLPPST